MVGLSIKYMCFWNIVACNKCYLNLSRCPCPPCGQRHISKDPKESALFKVKIYSLSLNVAIFVFHFLCEPEVVLYLTEVHNMNIILSLKGRP